MAPNSSDTVVRAMTDDGAFRVLVAETTRSVKAAVEAQAAVGDTARHFGDLLTCAVLFRETMAPDMRVQAILKGANNSGQLIADSHPSGMLRGLVQLKGDAQEIALGEGAVIQLVRTLRNGNISQGVVQVPEQGGISAALMAYMQTSEQIVTMIAVDTLFEGNTLLQAGGYVVQLLPGTFRGPLMVMTERLRDFQNIEGILRNAEFSPRFLLEELLHAMPHTELGENQVRHECWCDELRLVAALASLSRADLEHLLASDEVLEITCEYCKREYKIPPARLRGLEVQS